MRDWINVNAELIDEIEDDIETMEVADYDGAGSETDDAEEYGQVEYLEDDEDEDIDITNTAVHGHGERSFVGVDVGVHEQGGGVAGGRGQAGGGAAAPQPNPIHVNIHVNIIIACYLKFVVVFDKFRGLLRRREKRDFIWYNKCK